MIEGRCHCGNLTVRLQTDKRPSELACRACSCGYCRPRRVRWTSDPEGRVEIVVGREDELSRYRFGTQTADFLICRRCGYLIAAVGGEDELRAVVNVDVLDDAAVFSEAGTVDLEGETVQARLARRARAWTPAIVTIRARGQRGA